MLRMSNDDNLIRRTFGGKMIIAISALAIAVITFGALILPASTQGTKTYCGHAEHQHGKSCYTSEKTLTCGQKESSGHKHSDECYQVEKTIVCGLLEDENHQHDDTCYQEDRKLVCEIKESEGHHHSDGCYKVKKKLSCDKKEHKHTLACYSNSGADLETEEQWTRAFKGIYSEDKSADEMVVEIAKSQLGYTESSLNYDVAKDGKTRKGITRYGQWYGDPYGDWCAMFCSFCIRYAGISVDEFPIDANCNEWIGKLKSFKGDRLYHSVSSSYEPKAGDLIFYDFDNDNVAEHMGFVYKIEGGSIVTIEGNHNGKVEYVTRNADSGYIMGFGEIPGSFKKGTSKKVFKGDDFKVTASYSDEAGIPRNAGLHVEEIEEGSREYEKYLKKALKEYNDGLDKNSEVEITFARFFDISFISEGKEIEPEDDIDIRITYDDPIKLGKKETAKTVHFSGLKVEVLDTKISLTGDSSGKNTIDTFKFSSDSFSVFGNTTTVKYKEQEGTYYKKVDTIDSTSANYIIVSVEGNYALNRNTGTSPAGTPVELNPVYGNEDYFTVTGLDTSKNLWTFSATGKNTSSTVKSGTSYIKLDNSNIVTTSSSNVTRTYSTTYKGWTLKVNNNYLTNATGNFSKSTTEGTSARMLILKQVTEKLKIPQTSYSGEGSSDEEESGSEEEKPSYDPYIDPSLKVSGNGKYTEDKDISVTWASDKATSDIERLFTGAKCKLAALYGTSGTIGNPVGNLVDGNKATKYKANPSSNKVYAIFESEMTSKVSKYSITTADDTATNGGLPSSWTLYGRNTKPSNSSSTSGWTVINTVSSPEMSNENSKCYDYYVKGSSSYKYFMIVFTSTSAVSLAELNLHLSGIDDGRVATDKSVTYMKDDYGAFTSYDNYSFGVTLSALAQEFQVSESEQVSTPLDVVFIIDASGSMEGNKTTEGITRNAAVVNAVNSAMNTLMTKNTENRAGIVLYSSGGSQLLPLDHYKLASGTSYLDYDSSKIRTNSNLRNSSGGKVSQTYGETGSFTQGHGTYTQYGIALGTKILQENSDTTYTATVGEGTELEKSVTVTRQPVIILLSDGDPTHCTNNYMDVLNGPHYGSGVYTNNDRDANNKGIHGYYTILSANYYKSLVGINYNKKPLMYTIGMGINQTGYEDLSTQSRTGDHYKRAVLDPTSSNIAALTNTKAKNYDSTSHMLKSLLENTYTNQYVMTATTTYDSLGGSTSVYAPVISNPYSSVSYADEAYFGNLGAGDLTTIFESIIKSSQSTKNYGLMLQKQSACEMEDTIGDGMEVKDEPKLYYEGKVYKATSNTSGTSSDANYDSKITYKYKYTIKDTNLNNVSVSVLTNTTTGSQKVVMSIPDTVMPVYSPGNDGESDWYYESLPIRLIYKVELTAESVSKIKSMNSKETLTFNTNKWTDGVAANSTVYPTDDNPYYATEGDTEALGYQDTETKKEENASATAENSLSSKRTRETVSIAGNSIETKVIKTSLGNNGTLSFSKNVSTLEVTKLWDGVSDEKKPESIKIQLYRESDNETKNPVGEEVTITPDGDGKWKHKYTGLLIEDTKGDKYRYSVEELTGGQFTTTYNTTSAKYNDTDKVIDPIIITNTAKSYILPKNGGMGTKIFTIGGMILLVFAIVAILTRRFMMMK